MKQYKDNRGFTLIEVVIVLALAAFIFTIVFFAVPQLQRALRDNQRNQDASRIVTELINYASANEGQMPQDQTEIDDQFVPNYIAGLTLRDPSEPDNYTFAYERGTIPANPSRGEASVIVSATCDGDAPALDDAQPNDVAVVILKDNETGVICRTNN